MTASSATPALIDQHRTLGRQFFEAQDRLRGGPDPALCTPDYTARIGGNGPMDRAGHEGFAVAFYQGFPDAHHIIEDVVATDEGVDVRFTLVGTNTASLFGMPATGRPMRTTAIAMMKVRAGKVCKLDAVFDEAGMLRQLGILPG